jgi:hypothetical protein
MPTNSEESVKASPGPSSIPEEAVGSPIIDTPVSSISLDTPDLSASTTSSEVSKHTKALRNSSSVETFQSKETSGGPQENERTQSSPEEGLKMFSTDKDPVSSSHAELLCEIAEEKVLSESASEGNKQSSDVEESDLLAGPTHPTGLTNDALQLGEINEKERGVQVGLIPFSTLHGR